MYDLETPKKVPYGMRPTVREQVVPVGTEHFENWTTNLCGEAASTTVATGASVDGLQAQRESTV